jgi:signal peptidase I
VSRPPKALGRLRRAAVVTFGILVVLLALDAWVAQHGRVRLRSMEPTLSDGDWVLFEKLNKREIRRFDIVVFKAPRDPDKVFIKRVVGLENEIVEARGGRLFVDQREVDLPAGVDWGEGGFGPELVNAAHCFVVGDNFTDSEDSRSWGCVPRDYVLGRVFWRFWPLSKWRLFGEQDAVIHGAEDGDKGIQADG